MPSQEQAVRIRLYNLLEGFRHYEKKRGLSGNTIKDRCRHLRDFAIYLESNGIYDVGKITLSLLRNYHKEIYWRNSAYGKPYTSNTLSTKIYAIRAFFRYLSIENLILKNPAVYLKIPKLCRIPGCILSLSEVEALLSQPDVKTYEGLRDRAILELFYSTGIRRQEAIDLNVMDVNLKEELLFIRKGKGGKDRVVPTGRWAAFYLKKYLDERKKFAKDENALFLCGRRLRRINYVVMGRLVKEYAKRAGIEKHVSCHVLRHTCAVHFLEGGAGLREVQELLGHSSIRTTQIYLTVSKEQLKKVHEKHHPRGKSGIPGNNLW